MLTLLLLACTGVVDTNDDKTVDDSALADDSAADDSAVDTAPVALHGEVPDESFPAPEFTAQSHLGQPRSRADLLGHPTVMWFFPSAGTFG